MRMVNNLVFSLLLQLSLNATNVSFGVTKDGFFDNTQYLVW